MSELEAKQPNTGVALSAEGTPSVRDEADPWDWDRVVVPMLWFFGTNAVIQEIFHNWLPLYLSDGIAFFIAGLVVFRFRGPRWARYGFRQWLAFFLLVSAGVTLLHVLLSALPSYLSLGTIVFLAGLALFRFRGPRWVRYGFVKWVALCLLISASVSLLVFLLSAFLSVVVRR